jgi:hypothetical protein
MSDQTTPEATTPAATLATLPTQQGAATIPTWGKAEHLSPLSVFRGDRVEICTYYQLNRVAESTTAAHLQSCLHHARAAVENRNSENHRRLVSLVNQIREELSHLT